MLALLLPFIFQAYFTNPIRISKSASVEWAKQQAFVYVHDKRKNSCRSGATERYISGMNCQEKLFKLNRKYTLLSFIALDDSLETACGQHKSDAFPIQKSNCEYEVEFSKYLIDDLLVCEVFPKGDRTFIVSEIFIFKLTANQTILVDKQTLNYN